MTTPERNGKDRTSAGPSIHDNRLASYSVSADERRIILRTVSDDGKELADVEFIGVIAYRFESDNFQTILFEVSEKDAAKILEEEADSFEEGRAYCRPGTWNSSADAVLAKIREDGVRGYELSSSFGMNGWVLAAGMNIRPSASTK